MPRYLDVRHTVLIVVGYGILPEEEDRPIAYELKRAIDSRGAGDEQRSAVVVTDVWMLNQEMAAMFPAIAIGGPGVNAFAAQIYEELPVAYARDQRVLIQVAEGQGKRALVWGMDHRGTRDAADRFVKDGFLDRFLERVWRRQGQG
jgi:hypothetical protein